MFDVIRCATAAKEIKTKLMWPVVLNLQPGYILTDIIWFGPK